MYKRILVPTDGSPLSIEAVRGAARFAKPLGASVVLITVIEPYSYTSLSEYRPESIDDYDERMRAVAEERVSQMPVPSSTRKACLWRPLPSSPSRLLKR